MTDLPAFLLALLAVLALGGFPWRLAGEAEWTAVGIRALLAGVLGLHLAFDLLAFAGVRWTGAALLGLAAVTSLLWWRFAELPLRPRRPRLDAGRLVAALAVAVFAWYVLAEGAVIQDFVNHWGVKARRFAMVGGFDVGFVRPAAGPPMLAEYPCLLTDLYAAPMVIAGRLSLHSPLGWSIVAFALSAVIADGVLRRARGTSLARGMALATFALVVARFAIGHRLGGNPDWWLALALLAATPALLDPLRPRAGLEVALAAAVAAVSKVEGMPLALLLLGTLAVRRWSAPRGSSLRRAALRDLAGGAALVGVAVAPWLLRVWRFDLHSGALVGGYSIDRLVTAAGRMAHVLTESPRAWGWWPLVLLALLPLGLAGSRTRGIAAVAIAQLGVFAVAYSGGSPDPIRWIDTSFVRLLFQIVPALLLVLLAELVRRTSVAPPVPAEAAATSI